jgi:hypothetical protein
LHLCNNNYYLLIKKHMHTIKYPTHSSNKPK